MAELSTAMADQEVAEAVVKKLAVVSPYSNLRGIYSQRSSNEGRPAFVKQVREGDVAPCIFFTSKFSSRGAWWFGKYLPKENSGGLSAESFCISLGDARTPELASWPDEDITEVREATDEDLASGYFFQKKTVARSGEIVLEAVFQLEWRNI